MRNCAFLTIAVAVLFCAGMCSAADLPREAPAADSWTVLLSGQWEFAPPDSTAFKPIKVPGVWGSSPDCVDYKMSQAWRTGTYRRDFTVPEGMTGAAVEFDSIRWGGEVLVNGKSAGKYDLGFSRVAFDVSAFIKPGVNRLEVKPVGWSAIERFEGGGPTIPVGAGNWFGNKSAGITGDVFLRFHKGARVRSP